MSAATKTTAAAAAPGAACEHAACGKRLQPPLLCCSRCKKVNYCSKPCQVERVCARLWRCSISLVHLLGRGVKARLTVSCTLWHQTAAWKAGHKHTCAGSSPRKRALLAAPALTEDERQLKAELSKLEKKQDALGVLRLERKALALADKLRDDDPETAGCILNVIGISHYRTGSNARAYEVLKQQKAISEAHGDLAGVAAACGNLGLCYFRIGEYRRALELHEQDRALCEALGNRVGAALACGNLGLCHEHMGDYVRARELHERHRAVAEAQGDRAMLGGLCGNIGNCYYRTGEYERARELYEQHRVICEALGDRAGVARAYGNLGSCHKRTGDYARARELHEQERAMCKVLGDRSEVASACFNLGDCCLNTGDYEQAISYFTEQYNMAKEMQVVISEADAALGVGVALRLLIRDDVRGMSPASASGCGDARVQEAGQWLQTALDSGCTEARLHLACLAWDAGDEHTALGHLQRYLSWCVECGPKLCAGCFQTRGENVSMLTCGGCRVARFCSAEHQKMASRDVSRGGSLFLGRHKDVCGLLGAWRQRVVKDGAPPDALRAELLAFLRR
jgi:tetratricopeptide (TPR) repeat protein